jgi:glycosyltransferase involved in cell wall biosynthesis
MIKKRSLACLGDAGSINAWSNIPYHFFTAGKKHFFFAEALNLVDPAYNMQRLLWRMRQVSRFEGVQGYQYSLKCARTMWDLIPAELKTGEIISHFQTFPFYGDAEKTHCKFSFYCDATLTQLWGNKDIPYSDAMKEEILQREGEGYRRAHRIVAMSRSCADSFINDYNVAQGKVYTVRPGANLDESFVQAYLDRRGDSWREAKMVFSDKNPARLGFIGVDYKRKGLARLVAAAEILDGRGHAVKVTVIGECSEEIARNPLVEYQGRINKSLNLERFLTTVDSFAIGCLLSYAEPLGISTLECLRLGVPVLGTDVGGISDCVAEPYGILVKADADAGHVADILEKRLFDQGNYSKLVNAAKREMNNTTWDNAVQEFLQIWAED